MDKKKKSQQNRDSEKLLNLIKNSLQLSFSFMVRNQAFSLMQGIRQECLTSPLLYNTVPEVQKMN